MEYRSGCCLHLITGNSGWSTSASYVEQVYGRPSEWSFSVQYNYLEEVGKTTEFIWKVNGVGKMADVKQTELWIGGEWMAPSSGNYLDDLNPLDDSLYSRIADGTAQDMDRAPIARRPSVI
jgi:hypothetical protein